MDNPERDILEVDALFVGAGPASLAGALHLKNLSKENNLDISIAVIEKAAEVGAHSLSGAIVDPKTLIELFPNLEISSFPFDSPVKNEYMYYLTKSSKFSVPYIPGPMSHHGCFISSIGKLTRWLGEKCESEGIDIFCGFPGSKILYDESGKRVIGVRTSDRGIDKNGVKKANFESGADIHSKITILGEGTRGSLTKQLIKNYSLDKDSNAQSWALGVKELWQIPEGRVNPGYVAHTLGQPLGHNIFGGGFIYGMKNNILDIGIVVGLDYKDSRVDPHHELQRLKSHPWVKSLIDGGEMLAYGAKSLPEGGYYSLPKLYVPGCYLIGDSAGFLNGQRLKGIHLAMKSGMIAGESALEIIKNKTEENYDFSNYDKKIKKSWLYKELYKVRNFHQGFKKGLISGMINAGMGLFTGGRGFGLFNKLSSEHFDYEKLEKNKALKNNRYENLEFDGKYLLDKVTDVYFSATSHDEDQIPHLHIKDSDICIDKCTKEYGNPCQYFCPANVYEMVEEERARLQINFSNCVHCKTCDIMDPYQIIDWVPPDGGDGPSWKNM